MKKITVLTLFPDYFKAFETQGKASSAFGNSVELEVLNLREFSGNKYQSVDDYPYGGGHGMVIRADVLKRAIDSLDKEISDLRIIFPCPRGIQWDREQAHKMASSLRDEDTQDIVLICGRYEGIDERFIEKYVTEMYSLGDFILTGGELAVMAIIDSVVRLIPGTLGNSDSTKGESFEKGLLEHGHYTRPAIFEGLEVPTVLLSGHHKKIEQYRAMESKSLTEKYRPDLLEE
ncbi:MAG: tRNA (guanosine(37)-N1)-methyltransferase TrmD [Bdellovibrionales bacterium]|nr:tRNA (guanosine(37)-N1)-methyltransferase TrmD [Bdellovibrionales bacterium]